MNHMIFGAGAHRASIRATMFSRSDRGICWMSGKVDEPQIVTSAFVNGSAAELVVALARQLHEDYGNITDYALGQGPSALLGDEPPLLTDEGPRQLVSAEPRQRERRVAERWRCPMARLAASVTSAL
ncbi:hypothetical protein [Streptomyces sp. NPDC058694]|uniref:hypothetical protein n=1 Tax=Streptomyces sp. NPDC058694 TaxID=3346603 RepID=UPI00366A5266